MVSAFWSELRYRLRAILRRGVLDRDLDDELRFHIEREAEKHVAQGLTRDEASRRARTAFGGREQIKEECRDVGRVNLIEDAWKDLRHGARGLRRSPGFAATMVLILALGIGAATAIFSVAYGVLFRSLPYQDPAQLMRIYWSDPSYERNGVLSPPQFMSLREQTRAFTDIVVWSGGDLTLTGRGEARWVDSRAVSAGFFEVMGAEPILGRTFVESENFPGSDGVAVISHALWQEVTGGRADIVGQTLTLDDRTRVVVGVMAAGFDFPDETDVWIPLEYDLTFSAASVEGRRNNWLTTVGRLRDGVTPGDTQSDLDLVA
ncbi:MAG: ABC transporter permease, partial [Candidatus Rokuibacteriota bacterium]